MKKLFKNKYVVLLSAIIILSIVYFWGNKAIKKYNFKNNEDLVIKENDEDSNLEEEKIDEAREEGREYADEEIGFVTEEPVDYNESSGNEGTGENVGSKKVQDIKVSPNKIYVYITGEINNPGVLTLNEGSRIVDAINAAGGTTSRANISKVNLVYVLDDGMKVNIPNDSELKNNPDFEYITMSSGDGANDSVAGNTGIDIADSSEGGSNSSNLGYSIGVVNINTATQTELETLPGIGPSTALKIINYRKENGKFSSIEEIKNVSGIGESKFDELKKYIKV